MVVKRHVLLGLIVCGLAWESAAGKGKVSVDDSSPQPKSVAAWRARGPEGLLEALRTFDKLQAEYAELRGRENQLHSPPPLGEAGKSDRDAEVEAAFAQVAKQKAELERRIERTAAAIDRIGGQRSCTVSRLYWYTDLEQAKVAAERSGQPILSLRMLGKLTDEYSCANSRFFRTALYSNKDISDFLRTNFVLHWQSVRPVPRVTIDFGDGRKLERTLTGNSAHYVLTSTGEPLDVLPGLYGPRQFQEWLVRLRDFHTAYAASPVESRRGALRSFHARRRSDIMQQWDADIERLEPEQAAAVMTRLTGLVRAARPAPRADADSPPPAALADAQSMPKRATAARIMRFANFGGEMLERSMDEELWRIIAALHRKDVKLDETSIALMRREAPLAADAARRAFSKSQQEDPILRVVNLFEDSMTLDTVRNEYLLHRRIHEQFIEGSAATANVEELNEWVYAELFLTPSSDPWLGLAPRDVYTALEKDGRTEPKATQFGRAGG